MLQNLTFSKFQNYKGSSEDKKEIDNLLFLGLIMKPDLMLY